MVKQKGYKMATAPTGFTAWSTPVLPVAYDDSLSYLEKIGKMKEKLNETIKYTTDTAAELTAYVDSSVATEKAWTTAQIEAMRAQVEAELAAEITKLDQIIADYDTELNVKIQQVEHDLQAMVDNINVILANFKAQYQADFAAQTAEIDNKIEAINMTVANLKTFVSQQMIAMLQTLADMQINTAHQLVAYQNVSKSYTDTEIEKLKDSLPQITSVVASPLTGELQTLQQFANTTNYAYKYNAFTAAGFDSESLTCYQLDQHHVDTYNGYIEHTTLTAAEYDLLGYQLLHVNPDLVFRNPLSGLMTGWKDIVYYLMGLHDTGQDCTTRDGMDLTAEMIDSYNLALDWSAYLFDSIGYPNNIAANGLTCLARDNMGSTASEWGAKLYTAYQLDFTVVA